MYFDNYNFHDNKQLYVKSILKAMQNIVKDFPGPSDE